jgi:RNA recognition motif-containing protein
MKEQPKPRAPARTPNPRETQNSPTPAVADALPPIDASLHEEAEESSDEDHSDSDSDSDAESEDQPSKPQLPPPESGTTLFVRNVPFTATDDELRAL